MKKIVVTGVKGSKSTILAQLIERGFVGVNGLIKCGVELRNNIKELLEDKDVVVVLTICHAERTFEIGKSDENDWLSAAENFELFKNNPQVIPIRTETLIKYPNVVQNHLADKLTLEKAKSFEHIMRKEKLDTTELAGPARKWDEVEAMLEHSEVKAMIKRLDYE